MNSKYLKKTSLSVVVVTLAVACVMVGCQKEIEDEMIYPIKVKKIDGSYNPVRLKNGNENDCNNKTLVASYTLSSLNPKQIVSLPGNKVYQLQFKSTQAYSTSNVNMRIGSGPEETFPMSQTNHGNGGSEPERYEVTTASGGGSFTLTYQSGSPGQVLIYRCD